MVIVQQPAGRPVVTVEANYLVGGDETPDGLPGTAHALEHMFFRGCTGMTGRPDLCNLCAMLGGENNADTQQTITQYYATIPAADLDVALEAQAACVKGVDNTQAEWDKERVARLSRRCRAISLIRPTNSSTG